MFRLKPNGCTRRHKTFFNRSGPCLKKIRGDPPALRLVDLEQRFVGFDELEPQPSNFKQKERQS